MRRTISIGLIAALVMTTAMLTSRESQTVLQTAVSPSAGKSQIAQRYPQRKRTSNFYSRSKISNTPSSRHNRGSY